ncbi:MAG: NUDIX hydrolase [Ilumatobacteraceae bacterium]
MTSPELNDRPSGSAAFYASLPTKHVSAGCLLRDEQGHVLIVKPTYKAGWEIPGGSVEANESPFDACRREVLEELGLRREPGRLLVVDYRRPVDGVRDDALRIVFDGGVLNAADLASIALPPDELSEWRLVAADELGHYFPPALARRLRACLTHPGAFLEEGIPAEPRC